jgi:hypothetical protein
MVTLSLLVGFGLTPEASSLVESCTRQLQPRAMPSRSGHWPREGQAQAESYAHSVHATSLRLRLSGSPAWPVQRSSGLDKKGYVGVLQITPRFRRRATSTALPEAEETLERVAVQTCWICARKVQRGNGGPDWCVVEISPFGTPARPGRPRGLLVNLTLGRRPCVLGVLTTIPTGFG